MRGSFIILALFATLACQDEGPTSPANSRPTTAPNRTPTPGPLAGIWSGTISHGAVCSTRDCVGGACGPENVTAQLGHNGDSVSAHFLTACYGPVVFDGTLAGDQLSGHLMFGSHGACGLGPMVGDSHGTATVSAVHLQTRNIGNADCFARDNTIELLR